MQTCRGNTDTRIASGLSNNTDFRWTSFKIYGATQDSWEQKLGPVILIFTMTWCTWLLVGVACVGSSSRNRAGMSLGLDRDWTTATLLKPASPLPPSPPNWAPRLQHLQALLQNTVHTSRLPVPRVPPKNANQAEMSRTPQSLVIQQVHHAGL